MAVLQVPHPDAGIWMSVRALVSWLPLSKNGSFTLVVREIKSGYTGARGIDRGWRTNRPRFISVGSGRWFRCLLGSGCEGNVKLLTCSDHRGRECDHHCDSVWRLSRHADKCLLRLVRLPYIVVANIAFCTQMGGVKRDVVEGRRTCILHQCCVRDQMGNAMYIPLSSLVDTMSASEQWVHIGMLLEGWESQQSNDLVCLCQHQNKGINK